MRSVPPAVAGGTASEDELIAHMDPPATAAGTDLITVFDPS